MVFFELDEVDAEDAVACEDEPLACEIDGTLDMASEGCGRLLLGFSTCV